MIVGLGNAVNAAPPLLPDTSTAFPPTGIYAVGVYPGGQSENPASPWYENLVEAWWNGEYLAIPVPGQTAGPVIWRLYG